MARNGALSSAIMAAGTMVSRVLGFVKTFLITIALGVAYSHVLDLVFTVDGRDF